MTETLKTIRVIPFSGKEADWNRWSKTFMATATVKGYRDVLVPIDPDTEAELEDNIQAYNDLILSCQEDITFGIVDESVSETFPDGDARVAWTNLKARFEPNTGAAKVQLKQEFHQLKLSSADEDPDPWLTNLELKRRRLKTLGATIEDDDIILHILNNLPKEYETVVELCEEDLSRGNVNLQTVKERIRARYTRLQKAIDDPDDAVALMMKTQFKKACTVCGKIGHKGVDCFTLEKNKEKKEEYFKKLKEKKNKGKNKKNWSRKPNNDGSSNNSMAMTNIDQEMILVAKNEATIFSTYTWIADSGATTHMTNNLAGMFDLMDANICISVGDGRKMTTVKIGKWKGMAIDLEGRKHEITLTNVSYVPQLMVNLFSLTAAMEKGYSVVGSKEGITLQKDSWLMKFDRKVGTPRGHVFATTLIPATNYEIAQVNLPIGYEKAHQLLGHPGQNKLLGTAERLGWILAAKTEKECEDCLKGKARRLNLNKEAKNKSIKAGERLMIDISSVKNSDKKQVGRYWLLIVDEATDMKWSFFLKKKSNQVPVLMGFIKKLFNSGYNVKYIRCDNAGENISLKESIDKEGLSIKFEFTARMTPQQNGKVERAFATLYGRMRAMMNGAGWSDSMKQGYWIEAAATATKMENILNEKGSPSPYYSFYKANPEYEANLRTFGELGIVTVQPGNTIKSKLQDRGIQGMFVGYAENHAGNVYRVMNLKTKRVMLTRDVKWINKFIVELDEPRKSNDIYEIDTEDEVRVQEAQERPAEMDENEREEPVHPNNEENVIQPRLTRELRGLEPFNNPGRLEIEGENNQLCFFVPDANNEDDSVPLTFKDAWYHEDPDERAKWRAAIRLEFKQMLKNMVWRRKKGLNNLPPNRKGIGTKWVFKKKKNGVYRARLVAKGYNQIAGVDFQYNFALCTRHKRSYTANSAHHVDC
jgi:hypothetical protein